MTKVRKKITDPMDIWKLIAPRLLEMKDVDMEMYVIVYHALKLEQEYQKKVKT